MKLLAVIAAISLTVSGLLCYSIHWITAATGKAIQPRIEMAL